jgi:hypothetical protein|tara:strand:+ start:1885 stop:2211 length:327 start_codon:yes stop_codon:yes gene_type:complete
MTARSTWKASERRVAQDLLGQRIPVTGVDRDGADVVSPLFHVQVKLRKRLPEWLWDWLRGIVLDAAPHRKVGVLVLKKPRQRDAEGLVVLRYEDFVDLVGRIDGESHD